MTRRRPLLVVTLPARTLAAARIEAGVAAGAGADAVEIRFDRWTAKERRGARDLFPLPRPALATLRSRAEGGEGPDDPRARQRWLAEVSSLPFRYVDLEVERDRLPPGPAGEALRGRAVLSHHRSETLAGPELRRRLSAAAPEAAFVKLVEPATLGGILGQVVPFLPQPGTASIVVHTTGGSGALLRAWADRLGFAAVFCALPTGTGPAVEPSQIPVDRLRSAVAGAEPAPLFAVVGRPVAFSRSPGLHHRWMRAAGVAGLYVPLEVETEAELADAVPALARGGFRGINVTHPWKEPALALADRVAPDAEACGSANTLTFEEDGVEASNTDLSALLRRLEELRSEGGWDGSAMTVLGTGGAARAALAAARTLGVRAHVLGRDPARAAALAARFGAATGDLPHAGLVVHATPVGRAGEGPLALPLDPLLGPGVHLLDLVYAPDDPAIGRRCAARGATYEDGFRLLVYQAAATFERWWDRPVPEPEIALAIAEGPA